MQHPAWTLAIIGVLTGIKWLVRYFLQDDIDKVSCRPNFAIPVSSGYLKELLEKGMKVPAKTPPVFLVHGSEDLISTPEHSALM